MDEEIKQWREELKREREDLKRLREETDRVICESRENISLGPGPTDRYKLPQMVAFKPGRQN